MSRIQRLKNTLKKIITPKRAGIIVCLMVLAFFVFPKTGFAQDAEGTASAADTIVQQIGAFLTVAFTFLQFLLYPLTMLIAQLMDPDILIGPDMESKLLQVWVIFRNWVNIFFVLILVGIALYNVLGIAGDGSNYALKAILPKIVIGLIAVNFSFLAGKVLIDATNVLTTAVYALPTDLQLWNEQVDGVKNRICAIPETKDTDGDGKMETTNAGERKVKDGGMMSFLFCEIQDENAEIKVYTGEFTSMGDSFFKVFGAHNVSLVLMVNMGQVSDIDIVSLTENKSVADQAATLTMQMLFGILMFLLFGFAYVAVIVVLGARLVVLWICLALSPFIVIFFIFPDLGSFAGGEFDFKTQFFKHLFAPMVMGIVFSVGFVMLSVLQNSTSGGWMGDIGNISFDQLGDTDEVSRLMDSYGKDISDFGDLLIAACAVIIIWVGVFAAASQTIASSWTNTIKGAGESVGKFLAESPLYATVIPIKGKSGEKENVSLGGALFGTIDKLRGLGDARDQQKKDARKTIFGDETSLFDKYAEGKYKDAKKSTDIKKTQGYLLDIAQKDGARGGDWAKYLGDASIQGRLGLNLSKYDGLAEAIAGKDDKKVYELLRKNKDLQKAVFGTGDVAFDHDPVTKEEAGESSSQSSEEKAKAETETKAKEKEEQKKTIQEGAAVLGAGAAATMSAVASADQMKVVKAIDEVKKLAGEVTKAGDSATPEQKQQLEEALGALFDAPTTPDLIKAVSGYNFSKNSREFQDLEIKDGKLDQASFIQTVTGRTPTAQPTGAPAETTPPQGGATATTAGPAATTAPAAPPQSSAGTTPPAQP